MPPRMSRRNRRQTNDVVLFFIVLLIGAAGFGLLAAYEHGYFEDAGQHARVGNQNVPEEGAAGRSPDATRQPGTSASTNPRDAQTDPRHRPTLLTGSEAHQALYDSLSDADRESLQNIAEAVDTTLQGRRYRGQLTADDLQAAEKYSSLINSARWTEFWYRTAARTAGFPKFQRLRDRGDEGDLKSAAVAWVQLDGFTRGVLLEALQAIADRDEDLLDAHRETIEQYPFILGIDDSGIEEPEPPLRAPRR